MQTNSDLEWQEQQQKSQLLKWSHDACLECQECTPQNGKDFQCNPPEKSIEEIDECL